MNWRLFLLKTYMKEPGEQGGGGNSDFEWLSNLPEDVQAWPELKESGNDPEKFWKSMGEMRSRMGRSITLPGPDAGEDVIKSFHTRLMEKVPGLMLTPSSEDSEGIANVLRLMGHPEKADGYEVPEFDEKVFDKRYAEDLKAIAHKHGLTKAQFKGFFKDILDKQKEGFESRITIRDEAYKALTSEWGSATDQRVGDIKKFLQLSEAPADITSALGDKALDPDFMKWLYKVTQAVSLGEDSPFRIDTSERQNVMTPGEAQQTINEIMNNRKHPYWVASHPQHSAEVQRMLKLRALANPKLSTDPASLRGGAFVKGAS